MQSIAHVEELVRVSVYSESNRREWRISKRLPEGIENIEVLLSGEVYFEKDHKKQRFGRGTIFWHLGGEFDIWDTVRDKPYRCAVFTFRVARRVAPPAKIAMWQKSELLDSFVNEALELYRAPETDRSILGAWIYGTLLRQFIRNDRPLPNSLPYKLEQALDHIRSRFPEQVPLEELSRIASSSKVQLYRLFRQYFQCSPSEYILKTRLKHAANLISSGMDIPIVAEECRFQGISGFYKAFRRHYAMTPGEYRIRCKTGLKFPPDLHFSEH